MAHLPGISLITLGVRDVARSAAFYERLGFARSSASQEAIAFLASGTVALALFGDAALAEDAGVAPRPGDGFRGVTLARNLPDRDAVDAAHAAAVAAGGTSLVEPEEVFWGGYRGYVADPDGHVWEHAWNAGFPVDDDGRVALPGT